jgi:signal transduction histidine kinase
MLGASRSSLEASLDAAQIIVWEMMWPHPLQTAAPLGTSAAARLQPQARVGAARLAELKAHAPRVLAEAQRVRDGTAFTAAYATPELTYYTHYSPIVCDAHVIGASAVTTVMPVGCLHAATQEQPAPRSESPAANTADPSDDALRQLEAITENMDDALICVDKDWTITRVNQHHETISKVPASEQIGRNFLQLFFSSQASRKTIYWQQYHWAMRTRQAVRFEDYYAPLEMWASVYVSCLADGGLAVFFRDITSERRGRQAVEVEMRTFEAIFLESPTAMALLRGPELIFEKANPSYHGLVGERPILGRALLKALPELEGQVFKQLMLNVLTTGERHHGRETLAHIVRRPGCPIEDVYFDFTYSRVTNGRGEPYGVFIHAIDVTDSYLAKRETKELTDSLRAAIGARDDFLSSASHELKTPVTSLKMQLQMTRRAVKPSQSLAPPPEKLARTLDLCCRQVDRLTALVDDLLDVSRIASGKMTFSFEAVDLAGLLAEAADQFKDQFKQAGCTLAATYPEKLALVCDSFRIEQVVVNLLTNAIKYGAGSAIGMYATQLEDGGVSIRVTDQGMGIAADKIALVFDRFERAISHKNVSGLGLGLYICKQIIDAHHGSITVRSTLGVGSTFEVRLPADPRTAAPQPPVQTEAQTHAAGQVQLDIPADVQAAIPAAECIAQQAAPGGAEEPKS